MRTAKRLAWGRGLLVAVPVSLALALALAACDRDGPLDTVADTHLDTAVWRADAEKVAGVLPKRVSTFVPVEGADPFHTSYAAGPVFGASCTYADGARQLTVRIETGNVKARAAAALEPHPSAPADARLVSHEATVHGHTAVARWDATGRVGEVSFPVARRYLVQVRLVPAASESEAVALAEAVDVAPLESLALEGVTR